MAVSIKTVYKSAKGSLHKREVTQLKNKQVVKRNSNTIQLSNAISFKITPLDERETSNILTTSKQQLMAISDQINELRIEQNGSLT